MHQIFIMSSDIIFVTELGPVGVGKGYMQCLEHAN